MTMLSAFTLALFTAVAVVGVSAIRQLDLVKIQGIICQEGAI